MNIVRGVLLLFLTLIICNAYGQKFGVGIGYASSRAINFEMLLSKGNNIFKFGGGIQFSDRRGKSVDEQLQNYGQTEDGKGEYFWAIDFGYGRKIKEKISVDGELSIGANNHYTNYIDNRFNDGGYHLITKKETVVGAGLNLGYIINDNWNMILGFNTIKKIQFGVRIWL